MSETTTATISPVEESKKHPEIPVTEQVEDQQNVVVESSPQTDENNSEDTVNAICFTMSAKKWKLLKTLGLIFLILAIALMFLLFMRSGPMAF